MTPERKLNPRSTRASTLMVTRAEGVMFAFQMSTPRPSARGAELLRGEDSFSAAASPAAASELSSEAENTGWRRSRSLFFFALEEELR